MRDDQRAYGPVVALKHNGSGRLVMSRAGARMWSPRWTSCLGFDGERLSSFPLFRDQTLRQKLASIPEYIDEYQPLTGEIVVVKVIHGGCYDHVLTCLYILSGLYELGITRYTHMEWIDLAEILALHDIGKRQPRLVPGQRVLPGDVFEDGRLHAYRSALYAARVYQLSQAQVTLIRYHHHGESELPPDFPAVLRPAYRLLVLVDGLSAALTRRGATVTIDACGPRLMVYEQNLHPEYNGVRIVNIAVGDAGASMPIGIRGPTDAF